MSSSIAQPISVSRVGAILQRSLLAYIVILFFGDVAIYLSLAVSPRLEPQYWIGLLVVLAGTLAWFSPQSRWEVFRTPVFFWCAAFLALTLIFFAAIPASHIEQLKERIRDVVLLTAFLGVFLMLRDDLGFLRKLLVVAVVVGVVINLISLFNHNFLALPVNEWASRPAGFYAQPNESGIALVLGMVLSVGILPSRWRVPYAILVLAGVAVTFSREAVLGWLIVMVCLCVFNTIRWKPLVIYLVLLTVCVTVVGLIVRKTNSMNMYNVDFYHYQIRRFYFILEGMHSDVSATDRWKVLQLGWVTFLAHPWIGSGIGVTYHWSMPVSTHNMYLLYMDDYGIIGLFLYPALIWCMIRGARGETRKLAWTMTIFLLVWGLFDHNIVQNYYSLFAISMTAAMSRISATERAPRVQPLPAEPASG